MRAELAALPPRRLPGSQRAHQSPVKLGLALAGARRAPSVLGVAQRFRGSPGSLHDGGRDGSATGRTEGQSS